MSRTTSVDLDAVNVDGDSQLTETDLSMKYVTQTAKGGIKHFLTSSPVCLSSEQSLFKRTKQFAGETELLSETVESVDMAGKFEGQETFHMGSDDITKVVVMMKELMFPEIKAKNQRRVLLANHTNTVCQS